MQTKQLQWRFLNTLAIQHLHRQQRHTCHTLHILSVKLHQLRLAHARLSLLLNRMRTQHLCRIINSSLRQPLHRLSISLPLTSYLRLAALLNHAVATIPLPPQLLSHLHNLSLACASFQQRASSVGFTSMASIAHLLPTLLSLTFKQPSAIITAAQSVLQAARSSESFRSHLVSQLPAPSSLT